MWPALSLLPEALKSRNTHGLQETAEPEALHLHLRAVFAQGDVLRLPGVSPAQSRAAGVLLSGRGGADV